MSKRRTGPNTSLLARLQLPAWISRARFRWSIRRRVARYQSRIVNHSYGGHDLAISIEDPVGEEWYDHDWPLTPELICLSRSRLRPGARVFDLGAHQGVVALILSRLVGVEGEVFALESERHNFDVAVRNRDMNQAGNLTILHTAAGAEDGWLNFTGGLNGNVLKEGVAGSARIEALSVDTLAERHGSPDVVFIDVEGFEHEVLSGASRTLAGGRTDFFVEVHVGYGLEQLGGSADGVLSYFDPARFERLVCPARGELEHYEFCRFEDQPALVVDRFFLIALAIER